MSTERESRVKWSKSGRGGARGDWCRASSDLGEDHCERGVTENFRRRITCSSACLTGSRCATGQRADRFGLDSNQRGAGDGRSVCAFVASDSWRSGDRSARESRRQRGGLSIGRRAESNGGSHRCHWAICIGRIPVRHCGPVYASRGFSIPWTSSQAGQGRRHRRTDANG